MGEELFQTYSPAGIALGLEPRSEVHRRGLWHKAVQVFVFNSAGLLLLQQRAMDKDLHPGCWDSSVGEHLQPGETFLQGAVRGLQEELGVWLDAAELTQIGDSRRLKLSGSGYCDAEMQMAFRCQFDGEFTHGTEVQAVCWVDRNLLQNMLTNSEVQFTPWFYEHYKCYSALNSLS